MKATDLMIGDWVCWDGDEDLECPVRIDAINTEEAGVDGDYSDIWEPIPLTAEILEKNGIKLFHTYTHPYRDGDWEEGELEEEKKKYPMSVYQTLDPYITFVIRPNEQELKIHSSDYKTKVEKKEEIIFVHELQHALKLCGIEKEIKI